MPTSGKMSSWFESDNRCIEEPNQDQHAMRYKSQPKLQTHETINYATQEITLAEALGFQMKVQVLDVSLNCCSGVPRDIQVLQANVTALRCSVELVGKPYH